MLNKKVFYILLAVALVTGGGGLYLYLQKPTATNFEECAAIEGSVVLQTNPRQCLAPDGKTFTEEIETAYYGESFDGVLELAEGAYYTKEEVEERTEKEAFTFLNGLHEEGIPLEKAWYFKSQTSCGQLQMLVSPKILIKVKEELVNIPAGFLKVSEVSQCEDQSGWVFEHFEDCVSKHGDKYPGAYKEGEMECYLPQEDCPCWDGGNDVCIPVRHCAGQ